jgi:hypothetical protein
MVSITQPTEHKVSDFCKSIQSPVKNPTRRRTSLLEGTSLDDTAENILDDPVTKQLIPSLENKAHWAHHPAGLVATIRRCPIPRH